MRRPLIVVTGASGQLGQTLSRLWADAPLLQHEFSALGRAELDICDPAMTSAVLAELRPAVIVNAAAYTQVDRAESDGVSAYLANEAAAATLASWAAENSARLLHRLRRQFQHSLSTRSEHQPPRRLRRLQTRRRDTDSSTR